MIIKKRLVQILTGIVVSGIMISSSVAFKAQAAEAETMTKIFDLDSLITEAIDNNAELKLIDNQLVTQEKRYKNAVKNAEEKNIYDENPSKDMAETKRNILLYPMQVKHRLDELKWEKKNKIMTVKADVSKLYYQYVYKQKEREAQTKSIEKAKTELAVEQEKVRLGKISSLSVTQSENAVELATQKLDKLNSEIATIEIKINFLLNFDINQKVKFNTEEIKIDEYKVNDLEALIEKRKLESNSIAQLQRQIEEAKIEAYAESYSRGDIASSYEILLDKPKELENEIEKEKYNIEKKIRTDYISILNDYDDISIAKLKYDLALKQLEIAEKKYEKEMISYLDYLKAAEDKENALIEYNQAQYTYLSAVLDFKLYIEEL